MPQAAEYKPVIIREKIKEILLSDDYLFGDSGIYTNTQDTSLKELYYLPYDQVKIINYPAMFFVFDTAIPISDNPALRFVNYELVFKFQTAEQNDGLDGLDSNTNNCISRLLDIQNTIWKVGNSNLQHTCQSYSFSEIRPIAFAPDERAWTTIFEMLMTVRYSYGAY